MSDTTLRELDATFRRPIPPLEPTAVTMPSNLASIAGEFEKACDFLACFDRAPTAGLNREMLVNTADALRHIAETAAGTLGVLARAGIKPSPLQPTTQEPR